MSFAGSSGAGVVGVGAMSPAPPRRCLTFLHAVLAILARDREDLDRHCDFLSRAEALVAENEAIPAVATSKAIQALRQDISVLATLRYAPDGVIVAMRSARPEPSAID